VKVECAASIVARLALKPHPEGGWYREVHRSAEQVQTSRGARSALTTIYYLLERGQLSRWHVVSSDEIWHFYGGEPLELVTYAPASRALSRSQLDAMNPIGIVGAHIWQAARSLGDYSLVGCNVGPGFEFQDFHFVSAVSNHAAHFTGELAKYAALL